MSVFVRLLPNRMIWEDTNNRCRFDFSMVKFTIISIDFIHFIRKTITSYYE